MYLVWQYPYSLQQGAKSGHPSGQAILSGSDLNGGAGQLPAPSPLPSYQILKPRRCMLIYMSECNFYSHSIITSI